MTLWIDAARGYFSGSRDGLARREGIRVFYYHGLVERKKDPLLERNFNLLSDFQSHVRFLRRFRILSLHELLYELANNTRSLGSAAIVTFDDGYANNLLVGEIMSKARVPWGLFISTGSVDHEDSTWPMEVALLLLHGQARQLEALGKIWSLNSRNEREATFEAIRIPLKAMPALIRRQTMHNIRQQFPPNETKRLLREFPSIQMLSWEEVGELANSGVDVGSHGVDHEIHHKNQSEATCLYELAQSKAELEMRLNLPCVFFAFPNGDFTDDSEDQVRAAGYELGFSTQAETIKCGANPFLLPRLYATGSLHGFARDYFWEPAAS